MNWKTLTCGGKLVTINLAHVTHLTTEDGRTRVHFCVSTGGAETSHSTILVDEGPAVITGEGR